MLVGMTDRFAIEAQPEKFSNEWIWGRFRFWLGGEPVGDWEDWADLKGCIHWLRDFEKKPRDRFDSRLDGLDAQAIFKLVYDPVFGPEAFANPAQQPIPNSFARFHITHLGMSSFEGFDIILIKTSQGKERCLWRKANAGDISEIMLEPGEMEDVARRFCDGFEKLVMGTGA